MLKLYAFPRSGNSREVKIVLHEKNIPFEMINTHAPDFNKEDAEFRKASPQGKVPAIIDGSVYMPEAFHINQYLEEKYPQPALMPAGDAEKIAIYDWVNLYDKKLVLKIGHLVIECLLKAKEQQSEETKQRLRSEICTALADLDALVADREYLFGHYSLADIAVTPHIAALPILGVQVPAELKNFALWFERIKARPSFKLSAA